MTTTKTTRLELTGIRLTDRPDRVYILESVETIDHPNFKEKRFGWVYVDGRYFCDWVQYV